MKNFLQTESHKVVQFGSAANPVKNIRNVSAPENCPRHGVRLCLADADFTIILNHIRFAISDRYTHSSKVPPPYPHCGYGSHKTSHCVLAEYKDGSDSASPRDPEGCRRYRSPSKNVPDVHTEVSQRDWSD